MRKTAARCVMMMVAMGIGSIPPTAVLAGDGIADEPAASFETRWPQTPMREPTHAEKVRLVIGAAKAEVAPALAQLAARTAKPARCSADFCDLLSPR